MMDNLADENTVDIEFAGEKLRLLPDKALWWPTTKMLLIADTHFGKGEIFRQHGIAVPTGSTENSMHRISRLLNNYPAAEQLVVLGDFLHAKPSDALIGKIAEWSKALPTKLVVIRGNHDRYLIHKPASWQHIDMQPSVRANNVVMQHEPATEDAKNTNFSGNIICGHVHPVARLGGGGGRGRSRHDSLRMPVFWQQQGRDGEQLVLPSFGSFTGGYRIEPAAGTRLYIAGDDAVVPLRV